MRLVSSVAAVAVLAFAAPAFAQDAAPAPAPQAPAAAPAEADSPEEAAFEAKADAFGESMEAMSTEMQTAAAQTDKAKATTDLDAIQARYQPQVDAFAADLLAFAGSQGAPQDQVEAAAQQIKTIPAMVRSKIEQAAVAPAAPAASATPE